MALLHHLIIFLLATTTATAGSTPPAPADFLAASCSATQYPRLCLSSLSPHAAAIGGDPVSLARTALNLSLSHAAASLAAVAGMAAGELKPLEAAAVRDCGEVMRDAVGELKKSLAVMDHLVGAGAGAGGEIGDMQTWVSAALTNENQCVEGLRWWSARAAREGLKEALQMTSNALCFINALVPTP